MRGSTDNPFLPLTQTAIVPKDRQCEEGVSKAGPPAVPEVKNVRARVICLPAERVSFLSVTLLFVALNNDQLFLLPHLQD